MSSYCHKMAAHCLFSIRNILVFGILVLCLLFKGTEATDPTIKSFRNSPEADKNLNSSDSEVRLAENLGNSSDLYGDNGEKSSGKRELCLLYKKQNSFLAI